MDQNGKQTIDIDHIASGMTLAEPIVNDQGQTIMPAGVRLTPMFIVRLKKLNIQSIQVVTRPEQPRPTDTRMQQGTGSRPAPKPAASPALSDDEKEYARLVATDVSAWFGLLRDNPLMMDLRNSAIKRLVLHGKAGIINIMRASAAARENK